MDNRELCRRIAYEWLGRPYIWGGDDPIAGFDCSGFCIELLKSVGRLPRKGDWRAVQLYGMFPSVPAPYLGCLVFWGDPIHHVEFCLDGTLSIGASGGTSQTKTEADAIRMNAYIKIRPMASRPGIFGYVDPFLQGA